MKRIAIFGILMLFLAGLVSANPVITSVTNSAAAENSTITFNVVCMVPDNGSSVFTTNMTSKLIPGAHNNTSAVFEWLTGFSDAGTYDIEFIVSDTNSTHTFPKTVTVTNVNRAPVANAGADQIVTKDTIATLDASGSSDPDGDTKTYSWVQSSGPAAMSLSSTTAQKPTFNATTVGTLVFNLTVTDSHGVSDTDQITITVKEPTSIELYDLDVKVGSKTDSNIEDEGADGNVYEISKAASPEDKIVFDADVKNIGTLDLEDVIMRITIYGWDEDDDDVDDETDGDTIRDGSKKALKLEFDTPLRTDEGTYDVLLEIEGQDEDGNDQYLKREYQLKVDKDSHNIIITKAEFGSSVVSCNRKTNLDIEVLNLGSNDEDEIKITAKNDELGIDFTEWDDGDIELIAGRDDDAAYTVSVPVDAKDVAAGDYPVEVRVYRRETSLMDTVTATLTVEKCTTATTPTTPTTPSDEEEETDTGVDVIVTPSEPGTSVSGTQYPVVAVEESGFTDSNLYVVLLTLAGIVLIGLIVWIIALLVKK